MFPSLFGFSSEVLQHLKFEHERPGIRVNAAAAVAKVQYEYSTGNSDK